MADVGQDYRKSFTTSFITVFDELPGMKKRYDLLGIPQYSGQDFADIARRRKNFTLNSQICRKNYRVPDLLLSGRARVSGLFG